MSALAGRVAIVTGAGRGLGRAHALLLARLGAAVVVNDLGGDVHGTGQDTTPALQVVDEIRHAGGQAVASGHDVADWAQAAALVDLAVTTFGDLHVLVNNAGILRDRTLARMNEAEWDSVVRVHLKGHAAPTAHALAHWRRRAGEGVRPDASVIHTTSVAAFTGNVGQANYGAAKMAMLALSRCVSLEAGRHGVRSNAISPGARTRITEGMGTAEVAEGAFDPADPANVSPLVAWLAQAGCPADGQVFHCSGEEILVVDMPRAVARLRTEGRWTLADLDRRLPDALRTPPALDDFLGGAEPARGETEADR
ncbi:SDR family NAD(P)-dependent oxidoreductase [Streptosporangium carneum]|uniref:Short-chain dehydrogenase/reductase n=1 Tax=Streptosporangium carneum TaxID=47481 RepID=A0A9W6I1Q0_9ACTN|nr:SDR family NAD(P)-dependent oxidoreductase [Streptosporangium carneum]GLK09593.1 putative short-chain dehydrogenase/reductase [Streptosporangium carneum]